MLTNIIKLFQADITAIQNNKDEKGILRKLVAKFSNGNINLQREKYITMDILKDKQKRIFAHKFH